MSSATRPTANPPNTIPLRHQCLRALNDPLVFSNVRAVRLASEPVTAAFSLERLRYRIAGQLNGLAAKLQRSLGRRRHPNDAYRPDWSRLAKR
jgi:hypothetical protein